MPGALAILGSAGFAPQADAPEWLVLGGEEGAVVPAVITALQALREGMAMKRAVGYQDQVPSR